MSQSVFWILTLNEWERAVWERSFEELLLEVTLLAIMPINSCIYFNSCKKTLCTFCSLQPRGEEGYQNKMFRQEKRVKYVLLLFSEKKRFGGSCFCNCSQKTSRSVDQMEINAWKISSGNNLHVKLEHFLILKEKEKIHPWIEVDRFFDGLRRAITKGPLTAALGAVNDCGGILHINPLHLHKYKRSIQRRCLIDSAEESRLFLRIFKSVNVPVDKNCIVCPVAVSQQVSVSPKDKTTIKILQLDPAANLKVPIIAGRFFISFLRQTLRLFVLLFSLCWSTVRSANPQIYFLSSYSSEPKQDFPDQHLNYTFPYCYDWPLHLSIASWKWGQKPKSHDTLPMPVFCMEKGYNFTLHATTSCIFYVADMLTETHRNTILEA